MRPKLKVTLGPDPEHMDHRAGTSWTDSNHAKKPSQVSSFNQTKNERIPILASTIKHNLQVYNEEYIKCNEISIQFTFKIKNSEFKLMIINI